MERQIGQNYLDIWRSSGCYRERLSALTNVRVNVYFERSCERSCERLCERIYERSRERLCERS